MGQTNGVSNTVIDTPGRSNFIKIEWVTNASRKSGGRERQEMNIVHIKLAVKLTWASVV